MNKFFGEYVVELNLMPLGYVWYATYKGTEMVDFGRVYVSSIKDAWAHIEYCLINSKDSPKLKIGR